MKGEIFSWHSPFNMIWMKVFFISLKKLSGGDPWQTVRPGRPASGPRSGVVFILTQIWGDWGCIHKDPNMGGLGWYSHTVDPNIGELGWYSYKPKYGGIGAVFI